MMQKESIKQKLQHVIAHQKQFSGHSCQMSKISGQFQILGQFQDTFEISGQLGPLISSSIVADIICKVTLNNASDYRANRLLTRTLTLTPTPPVR